MLASADPLPQRPNPPTDGSAENGSAQNRSETLMQKHKHQKLGTFWRRNCCYCSFDWRRFLLSHRNLEIKYERVRTRTRRGRGAENWTMHRTNTTKPHKVQDVSLNFEELSKNLLSDGQKPESQQTQDETRSGTEKGKNLRFRNQKPKEMPEGTDLCPKK